jgi:inner membrane protein
MAALAHSGNTHGADFLPYFFNWEGLYEQGVIDGSEWRANRFHFLRGPECIPLYKNSKMNFST